ncbi:hypothetical protein ACTI_74030 [Actinoplanes sp. OR16]|nr:hypothetical protein ACTI_74030 [Actinoplanes sp. OR16]
MVKRVRTIGPFLSGAIPDIERTSTLGTAVLRIATERAVIGVDPITARPPEWTRREPFDQSGDEMNPNRFKGDVIPPPSPLGEKDGCDVPIQ